MKLLILITYFALLPTSHALANDCSSLKSDCEYYLCVEAQKKCGPKGYLKSFGHKYCEKFSQKSETYFSAKTKLWVEKTKSCLINSIDQLDSELSCRQLKKKAFKAHDSCYVSSGFCRLPKRQKTKILKVIGFSLFKPRIIKTKFQILKSCLKRTKKPESI